jgi:hypothetical protein
MFPRGESIDENGALPPPQNVEQGEACPRKSDDLDIAPIAEFGCEGSRCVQADAII